MKSCPNCGAEMKGAHCDFCGYIENSSASQKVETEAFQVAHPELFRQYFDKYEGSTCSLFELKYFLSLEHYYCKGKEKIEASVKNFQYIIEYDKCYKHFPNSLEDLVAFCRSHITSVYCDYEMSQEEIVILQTLCKAFYEAIVGDGEFEGAIDEIKKAVEERERRRKEEEDEDEDEEGDEEDYDEDEEWKRIREEERRKEEEWKRKKEEEKKAKKAYREFSIIVVITTISFLLILSYGLVIDDAYNDYGLYAICCFFVGLIFSIVWYIIRLFV